MHRQLDRQHRLTSHRNSTLRSRLPALAPALLPTLLILAALSGGTAAAEDVVKRIALLPADPGSSRPPSIEVLHESDDGLLLEFELPALTTHKVNIGNETYDVLTIERGAVTGDAGDPMLPTFSRLVRIPDDAGVSIEVIAAETVELEGYRPLPMQPEGADGFVINSESYSRSGYEQNERIHIGEPAIARDLRVVPITIQPVRFDPSRSTLEIATRIRMEVRFAGVDLRNAKSRHCPVMPPSFDRLYRELVVNYSGPRDDQIISLGSYVIICPNDGAVLSALAPLVEWRTRKGFDVYVATTAETGSYADDIKAWIQNAYDTWENPPEYITLVGDARGDIRIRTWFEEWSGYEGEGDHPYAQLEGDDVLADVHLGRISIEDIATLELYVTKIVGYESTPYMGETDWYRRACVVGDPSESGYTCIQVMQWVKNHLLEHGYAEVDTVFSSPWISQMTDALDRGDTAFSYRGFFGMSGFTTGHILNLQNGWKMPYAVNITCQTGTFESGTCHTEAWIRAGLPPSIPTGGIASVGAATGGTHTRYNNCMTYGIWYGVLGEGLYEFGPSLTRGKYELYLNYSVEDMTNVRIFSHWVNLMGDPAGELWTGVPQAMTVDHPAEISRGTNSVIVEITSDGSPCADAYVCLWKEGETFVGGYSDADGMIDLRVSTPTTGEMKITVTKHDHHPYLAAIAVIDEDRFVGYRSHAIDDDNSGSSSGNSDGAPNPTEWLEIPVEAENFGTQTATNVTGTLSLVNPDPYVTIADAAESFGDIGAGSSAWSTDDFDIEIAGGAPNGHLIRLGLDLTSGTDSWHSLIEIPVVSAEFVYVDHTLYDFGTRIDPGESGEISFLIENLGAADATGVVANLISQSPWVAVTDTAGSFGPIPSGSGGENTADPFGLSVASDCFEGHIAALRLDFEFSGGARDTVPLALVVGQAASSDPTGPDHYGYYAFDNTDTGYPFAPSYAWIEIDPTRGGSGTSVGLADFAEDEDDSRTVDLPFPFTYYGQTFTRATICSNGWIAMGSTHLTNYRNWIIPGAGAPDYLIAPMWDNLRQSGDDQVYHWYDATNHRYIVQWSRLRNMQGEELENFQVILYDTEHYPTETGDGMILFQYDTFNNSDYLQNYSTIGIQNGDQSDGLMYGYFSYYNTGAATIISGRAIRFVAFSDSPRGMLSGTVTNVTNGGTGVPGVQISLQPDGPTLQSGAGGFYGGSVPVGIYTITATHPSFTTETLHDIAIVEGETTVCDFALEDIAGPLFHATTVYECVGDTEGPYEILTTVEEYSAFEALSLFYNPNGLGWTEVPLEHQGGDLYRAEIPGEDGGSRVRYYLYGRDVGGSEGTDPPDAPPNAHSFGVAISFFVDDMEAGTDHWSHYVVTDGYNDEWHWSENRNHTPGGSRAWKFGGPGGQSYSEEGDGALETEPFELDGGGTLTFWHWMDSELRGWGDDQYASDGGMLEMSIDGGGWTPITPIGGYPWHTHDEGGYGSPFPPSTPVYAGEQDWAQAEVDLAGITGTVRIRFHFGSDNQEWWSNEGWYIDDVEILGCDQSYSGARELELIPSRIALHQNAPNPFVARTTGTRICFDLPQSATVQLRIVDAGGRLVRALFDGVAAAGRHEIRWDGADAAQAYVGSGVYFYILDVGGARQTKRMLIVR